MNMNNPTSQSLADKLEERLIDFAVRIIRLAASLPKTPQAITSRARSYAQALHPPQIMEKQEAQRVTPISSTS